MRQREVRCDKADDERVIRIDSSTMQKAIRTKQGFLRAPLYATRTGVFTYKNADGSLRRELRHPEDVFSPESLATLAAIPITDDHPNVKHPQVMLINAANTKEYQIGYTGEVVTAEGEYVAGTATITDAVAIDAIEKGRVELSCGYECDREVVAGVYNGEKYDVRQRNISYNHLALVPVGRAGPNVRLRLDSADAVQVENSQLEVENMEKILINGVEHEVTKAVADSIRAADLKAKGEADAVTAALAAEKTKAQTESVRADRAEAAADTVKTELTSVKAQLAVRNDGADQNAIRAAAKATIRILQVAERVLPKEKFATCDSLDNKAIMVEVIKTQNDKVVLDGKSDAYIEARFDGIVENLETVDANGKKFGDLLQSARNDSAAGLESESEKARLRSREASLNAWQTAAK